MVFGLDDSYPLKFVSSGSVYRDQKRGIGSISRQVTVPLSPSRMQNSRAIEHAQ